MLVDIARPEGVSVRFQINRLLTRPSGFGRLNRKGLEGVSDP